MENQKQYRYLTYSVKERTGREQTDTYIVIEKADPELETVQIPEQIEGIPVEELAPYAMSAGKHREICLPAGIRKIGRYAFYNCRQLQTFRFPSGLDLGSGAFTGCHQVKYLEVYLERGKPSCLREILAELHEEVFVEIHGEEEARLIFPGYFEEGTENTPARLLRSNIYGSGTFYRNCFQNRRIQYQEYDACFERALAWEQFSLNLQLAAARLRYPQGLEPQFRDRYLRFLEEHALDAYRYYVEKRDEEMVSWLLKLCPPEREVLGEVLEYAGRIGCPGVTALLLSYQRSKFPAVRQRRSL